MLVGNKSDDPGRQVSEELGKKLSTNWQCGFIETSAKNDTNIRELFSELLSREKKRTLTLTTDEQTKRSKRRCAVQ
jgi:GTPase SAR1 family protein